MKATSKRSRGSVVWETQCDCGKTFEVPTRRLTVGLRPITHCGCSAKKSGSSHGRWTGHGEIPGLFWSQIKHGAIEREIPFEVTIEEAWDLFLRQDRKCALSGIPLIMGNRGKGKPNTASLDRKDSSKRYSIENLQWVHKIVNRMKNNIPEADFLGWCQKITQHQCNQPQFNSPN